MIHLIGTCHKTQIWTDPVRRGALGAVPRSKIEEFQKFIEDTAVLVSAITVAEEMNEERVKNCGANAVTVAQIVARKLKIEHIFCEPEQDDRRRLVLRAGDEMIKHAQALARAAGRDWVEVHREEVQKQFPIREGFWADRLAATGTERDPIVFVCGADHCNSALKTFEGRGLAATISCSDWTLICEIPCPCCM